MKLLTVLIRLFEPENEKIVTRHLGTIVITELTADGIFSSLEETFSKYHLSFDKLLTFTSDTCNVMKCARNGMMAKLHAKLPKVIDVHYICHVVDDLVEIYFHFHRSVKRVALPSEYTEFCTTENKSVVKHYQTQWLSLGRSIKCILQMWELLCSYFCSRMLRRLHGKVRTISRVLKDPLTKPWLLYLSNVLPVFKKNNFFQTSSAATIHCKNGCYHDTKIGCY